MSYFFKKAFSNSYEHKNVLVCYYLKIGRMPMLRRDNQNATVTSCVTEISADTARKEGSTASGKLSFTKYCVSFVLLGCSAVNASEIFMFGQEVRLRKSF